MAKNLNKTKKPIRRIAKIVGGSGFIALYTKKIKCKKIEIIIAWAIGNLNFHKQNIEKKATIGYRGLKLFIKEINAQKHRIMRKIVRASFKF